MSSAGPRHERIRPCLDCGALVPFSASRCGSCGAVVAAADGAPDERVRTCIECGVILRYDQDPCPQCGTRAFPGPGEAGRVRPCGECSELLPFDQSWCDRCGEFALPIEGDQIPATPVSIEGEAGTPIAILPRLLGGAAVALGLGALAVALREILGPE